ncbi:MAG: excisionase family DNA-binding protein [Ardenticatenaceae bacterium]|nr:excisionase family DNA-binding protein [Ardenticatenaceae bacterium]MCB8947690.1 excisionase family DNA-binding protein [Ardenticatenaceae bacterium]
MNNFLPETEQWLSLSKASEFLGVHSTTLRRWADNGQIAFMMTPGGHRRFSLGDLQQFSTERRQAQMPASFEQMWAEKALTQTRQAISAHKDAHWLAGYDDEMREQHRLLGRRLMGLTLQYISDPETNGTLLKQAEEIGAQYGRLARQTNLPLTEALQATLLFRDMLVDTAFQLPNSVNIKPEANLRLMRRINELLNVVHLAIAQAYEGQP